MDDIEAMRAIVLPAYGLEAVALPQAVGFGTLNWNYRAETQRGPVFVRKHRTRDGEGGDDHDRSSRDWVGAEHELLGWLAERQVPVVQPLQDRSGATAREAAGAIWAVFPWCDGLPPVRGATPDAQMFAIGEVHGLILRVLAAHPGSIGPPAAQVFTPERSRTRLKEVLEVAIAAGDSENADSIAHQMELLERYGSDHYRFDDVPNQFAHGDFHDQQILFASDGQVAAVVDWEMAGMRPRVFEVVRSLGFSLLLHTEGMEGYMAGLRQHIKLDLDECRIGIELWWQSRLQGTWAWDAYYREGNARVAEFFPHMRRALERLADAPARRSLAERFAKAARGQ